MNLSNCSENFIYSLTKSVTNCDIFPNEFLAVFLFFFVEKCSRLYEDLKTKCTIFLRVGYFYPVAAQMWMRDQAKLELQAKWKTKHFHPITPITPHSDTLPFGVPSKSILGGKTGLSFSLLRLFFTNIKNVNFVS